MNVVKFFNHHNELIYINRLEDKHVEKVLRDYRNDELLLFSNEENEKVALKSSEISKIAAQPVEEVPINEIGNYQRDISEQIKIFFNNGSDLILTEYMLNEKIEEIFNKYKSGDNVLDIALVGNEHLLLNTESINYIKHEEVEE